MMGSRIDAPGYIQIVAYIGKPTLLRASPAPCLPVVSRNEDAAPVLTRDKFIRIEWIPVKHASRHAGVAVSVEARPCRNFPCSSGITRHRQTSGPHRSATGRNHYAVGIAGIDGKRPYLPHPPLPHVNRHICVDGDPCSASIVRTVRTAYVNIRIEAIGIGWTLDDILHITATEHRKHFPRRFCAGGFGADDTDQWHQHSRYSFNTHHSIILRHFFTSFEPFAGQVSRLDTTCKSHSQNQNRNN